MYLKFDEVVTANGLKENIVDQCIYMKVSGSKYNAYNDVDLLVETIQLLFSHFNIKDLGGSILCLRHTDTSR